MKGLIESQKETSFLKFERTCRKFQRTKEKSQIGSKNGHSLKSSSSQPNLSLSYLKKKMVENPQESFEAVRKAKKQYGSILGEQKKDVAKKTSDGIEVDTKVMRKMVKKLENDNKELKQKLENMTKCLSNEQLKNKCLTFQLEKSLDRLGNVSNEKNQLQKEIIELKQQLEGLKEQIANTTQEGSFSYNQFESQTFLQEYMEASQRKIHLLKEQNLKLELKKDYLVRKEFMEKEKTKNNLEEVIKGLKQELLLSQNTKRILRERNKRISKNLAQVLELCTCNMNNDKQLAKNGEESILQLSSEEQ